MFKKVLVVFAVLALALALVACGGTGTDTTADEGTTPPAVGDEHVHEFVEEIIPATCSATGKVISKCACGEIGNETEIPLADHTASTLDCEKDTVCTVCNIVLAEKTGHVFSAAEVVTPATCTTAGKEKGACVACGKIVETEIPATGHVAGTSIKAVDGGFASTCTSCSQDVVMKADKTVFALGFDEDVATEAAKYADSGLALYKSEGWKIEDGTLKVNGNKEIAYIHIVDPTKLAELGTFMISFDYMSTQEGSEADKASVFSILSNFYNNQPNQGGTTGWGWFFKLNEQKNVIGTVLDAGALNDSNSIAVERNVKYTIQTVIDPTAKVAHVFVNGKYIGNAAQISKISEFKPESATLRFGDGPLCGHVYDNFAIIDLK